MRVMMSIFLVIFLFSCKKKEDKVEPIVSPLNYALILNEGNFNWGNASISVLNLDNHTISNNVFESTNGRVIGDVLQSAYLFEKKWYLVLNNSNKIEIVSAVDFKSIGVIEGFTSPRYFVPVSPKKAYVTDLYSNTISVVDLEKNSIIKEIQLNGATEEVVVWKENVFITNSEKEFLYIINSQNDSIVDSVKVAKNGLSLAIDKDNKIFLLCNGNQSSNVKPILYKINSENLQKEDSLIFSTYFTGFNTRIRTNETKDFIYLLNNGINKIDVSNLSTSTLISTSRGIYGFGISSNGDIYLSDAKGFVENGEIFRYNNKGDLIDSMEVGRIPSEIYFYE